MLKRFKASLWTMGAMVPMILAGCSTTAPTATPATQPEKASFTTQGGVGGGAAPLAATAPCGECPSVVPLGGSLVNLQQLTANPVLDYSWYYARGNFATFGWAPGFYANFHNFMWYPTASGYWPYSFSRAHSAYVPYSTIYGGRTLYPYLGLGGGLLGSYAGLERRRDRDRDRDGGTDQGGQDQGGQGQAMGQGQGQGQGQAMGQGQGQGQGQAMGQGQGQGGGY